MFKTAQGIIAYFTVTFNRVLYDLAKLHKFESKIQAMHKWAGQQRVTSQGFFAFLLMLKMARRVVFA